MSSRRRRDASAGFFCHLFRRRTILSRFSLSTLPQDGVERWMPRPYPAMRGAPSTETFRRRMRYAPTLPSTRNGPFWRNNNPNRKKMKALLRERLDTKTGIPTSQDARLLCDKRRAYAAVGGRIGAEPAIRFLGQKRSEHKNGHPDFVGCPITMRQAHGLCCGRREYRR